jgi:endonuclease/exonuclease/phosphatase family metal-dependent hydrolase
LGIILAGVFSLLSCASFGPPADGQSFTIVSYNIGDVTGSPADPGAVARALSEAGWADIYAFQEVWSHAHLDELKRALRAAGAPRYHVEYVRMMRLALFSRWPLEECRALRPDAMRWRYGAMRCVTAVRGHELAVVNVHLEPIPKRRDEGGFVRLRFGSAAATMMRETLGSNPRSRGAHAIIRWLSTWNAEYTVVAGDLNTVPFTRAIHRMNRVYDDALRGSGDYLTGSYWKVDSPVLPRVDFVFHSADLHPAAAAVIRRRASDHYPVWAELVFR